MMSVSGGVISDLTPVSVTTHATKHADSALHILILLPHYTLYSPKNDLNNNFIIIMPSYYAMCVAYVELIYFTDSRKSTENVMKNDLATNVCVN